MQLYLSGLLALLLRAANPLSIRSWFGVCWIGLNPDLEDLQQEDCHFWAGKIAKYIQQSPQVFVK